MTINGGYRMRAWYDILGADLQRREDETGLRESARAIAALIDRERERGIAAHRIVLAGFSQGCAMTLLTGLRYPERLAGLAGMSGYLPLADSTAAERSEANRDVPIFLAHGSEDEIVAPARGRARAMRWRRSATRSSGMSTRWSTRCAPRRSARSTSGCCACSARCRERPQTTPCASIASATFTKPATLAPST